MQSFIVKSNLISNVLITLFGQAKLYTIFSKLYCWKEGPIAVGYILYKLYNVEILDKGENIDCIKWNTRLFIATKYRNVLMKNKFVKIEADYVVDQCMYT